MFVARVLAPAERRYSSIELELLAVRFVIERCHFYTYGRPVVVFTDHKPLLGLVHTEMDKIRSLRHRPMIERLFVYNLEFKYVPGRENTVADYLSRMSLGASTVPSADVAEAEMFATVDALFIQSLLSTDRFIIAWLSFLPQILFLSAFTGTSRTPELMVLNVTKMPFLGLYGQCAFLSIQLALSFSSRIVSAYPKHFVPML